MNRLLNLSSEDKPIAIAAVFLLVIVLAFYWAYDRIVGIDNVKLGG